MAEVAELDDDTIKVRIKGIGIVNIEPNAWPKYRYVYNMEEDKIEKRQTGSFIQYPVKLAYAVTVHKSQGQTFEHVTIDYERSGAFSAGQTYVALSRCRRLEDIHLLSPIRPEDIIVDPEVMKYMKKHAKPILDYAKEKLTFMHHMGE